MQTYYKLAFQTLKNLYDLQIISETEKTEMKDYILQQIVHSEIKLTLEDISKSILQRIKKQRLMMKKNNDQSDSLQLIEEETDEDELK